MYFESCISLPIILNRNTKMVGWKSSADSECVHLVPWLTPNVNIVYTSTTFPSNSAFKISVSSKLSSPHVGRAWVFSVSSVNPFTELSKVPQSKCWEKLQSCWLYCLEYFYYFIFLTVLSVPMDIYAKILFKIINKYEKLKQRLSIM